MSIKHAKTHLDVIFISAVTSSAFHSSDAPCLSSDNIDRTTRLPAFTPTRIKSKSDHYVESICVSEEDEMCAAHCKLNTKDPGSFLHYRTLGTHTISVNAIFLLIWEISSDVLDNIFSSCTHSSYTLARMCGSRHHSYIFKSPETRLQILSVMHK